MPMAVAVGRLAGPVLDRQRHRRASSSAFVGMMRTLLVGLIDHQAARPRVDPRAPRRGPRPARGHDRTDLRRQRVIGVDRCSRSGSDLHRARARRHRSAPAARRRVGLLDYYRQFEAHDRRGGQREPARGAAERRAQGARARRAAGPLAHDVARVPAPRRRQRDHLRGAARAATATSTRTPRALRAEIGPPPRASSPSASSSATAPPQLLAGGRARRCSSPATSCHAVAVLPALSADGPARPAQRRCRSPASAASAIAAARSTSARAWSCCATPTTRPASYIAGRASSARCSRALPERVVGARSTRRSSTSSTPSRSTRRCALLDDAPARC